MVSLRSVFLESPLRKSGLVALVMSVALLSTAGLALAQDRASEAPGFSPSLTRVLAPSGTQSDSPSDIKIGIVADDSGEPSGAISALDGTGLLQAENISVVTEVGSTPTLEELLAFDVLLVWTNSAFSDPVTTGDRLADYIDAGGSVVIATYAASAGWAIGGQFVDPGYMPLLPTSSLLTHSHVMDFGSLDSGHPLFDGISSLTYGGNSNYTNSPLNTDATPLATDTNGNNLIALNGFNTVVGISSGLTIPAIYKAITLMSPDCSPMH